MFFLVCKEKKGLFPSRVGLPRLLLFSVPVAIIISHSFFISPLRPRTRKIRALNGLILNFYLIRSVLLLPCDFFIFREYIINFLNFRLGFFFLFHDRNKQIKRREVSEKITCGRSAIPIFQTD